MIFQNRQEVREFLEVHQDGLDEYPGSDYGTTHSRTLRLEG